jgi:hypothetical protein
MKREYMKKRGWQTHLELRRNRECWCSDNNIRYIVLQAENESKELPLPDGGRVLAEMSGT